MRSVSVVQIFRFGALLQRYCSFKVVQKYLQEQRRQNLIPDTVLTLQYHHVYTVGKRGNEQHFYKSPQELRSEGFEVDYIDRGGEVTYHGPGQIVFYPVISLREQKLGARLFVEKLEKVMIQTAALYSITAEGQVPGKTGVWVKDRKIGAIGVRISQGISSHGFAFNVNPDLTHYHNILPCGFSSKDVTSLSLEAPYEVESVEKVEDQLITSFIDEFGYENRTEGALEILLKITKELNTKPKFQS